MPNVSPRVPHVSVLLAVYNGEATIDRAIESIVFQDYISWELIVIDDGSGDGTRVRIKHWETEDSRIIGIFNDENHGLAYSLNYGVPKCRGRFIARLDADDVMMRNRLSTQVNFLSSHRDIDIVGSTAIGVGSSGSNKGLIKVPETHNEIARMMPRRNPIIHSSILLRRYVLEKIQYDVRLRRNQDYDLWARTIGEFRFHNIQRPLTVYALPGSRKTWLGVGYDLRVHFQVIARLKKWQFAYWPVITLAWNIFRKIWHPKD